MKEDPNVGLIPSEKILSKNLCKYGCRDSIKLVKALSSDFEALRVMKDYNVFGVFIDGDHSYEGVRHDWTHYGLSSITPSVIALHDYNNTGEWLEKTKGIKNEYGINKLVDDEISQLPEYITIEQLPNSKTYVVVKVPQISS